MYCTVTDGINSIDASVSNNVVKKILSVPASLLSKMYLTEEVSED